MAKEKGETKAEWLAREVAKAVGAGKAWDCETVDFSDPKRPAACLEVDFPILPVNQIAAIEGNAGKPIYQMSKWWARRRSSVFRSMLLAAAMKAPDDPSEAAKLVWDAYYGNHQKKGAFKNLKVADIFMGGGTAIVEGSRLGMQMFGNDLNPVAWFVVKNEMAQVDKAEAEALLADMEREVKPQIMPFYACDCPRGHKGKWTKAGSNEVMDEDFEPTALSPEERKDYQYEGPEIIYVFWAKHGPCQVTGCGHRTPIMSSPVMAVKTLSVKYWERECGRCGGKYDLEEREARMAPGVPLAVAETEPPYAIAVPNQHNKPGTAVCPHCSTEERFYILSNKPKKKKIELTLLVHPEWLKGEAGQDADGHAYGGSADDSVEDTIRWNQARAQSCRLVEVRGRLPDEISCPETGVTFRTGKEGGSVLRSGVFVCGECGNSQKIVEAIGKTGKLAPVAMFAVQGYCLQCHEEGNLYGGRFFAHADDVSAINSATKEWETRKEADLAEYWPKSEIPFGHMTHQRQPLPQHGFTHWRKMFNARQLIVHASLLRSIGEVAKEKDSDAYMFLLGAFQQYLRNQVMFTIWNPQRDTPEPMFSNNNYHPKSTMIENCVFAKYGRGNWTSQSSNLPASIDWMETPWEIVSNERLGQIVPAIKDKLKGKSEKTYPDDPVINSATLQCGSSTELALENAASYDLVITDPPFGGLLHYSELSDFFYVWLRLVLKDKYPDIFSGEYTPKTLEAVANRARHPGKDEENKKDNADIFYQRLLTACWKEAHRILKPGGLLAFTFHHSEDAPWVSVLESLFDAGFYLTATYPIRSDETKGAGEFGSKKIEYDIIHVCRKRLEEPRPISWAKMRHQVLRDVRCLRELLEHHQKEGLPEADLQVIRRGKALEYFSRHYGKVFKDEETPISVLETLVGINLLLDEEAGGVGEPPPHSAEPFTRMFLRLFDGKAELARDQIQKFLRGTGTAPSYFVERGWCFEEKKVFYPTSPLDIAQNWQGRHRRNMRGDYDQAAFLIGACTEGSGISADETLNNPNFKPHPALGALLKWHVTHSFEGGIRNAATIADRLFTTWHHKHQTPEQQQIEISFAGEEETG
ncbi:MAG: DUF1156 domain-containing protein [Gammaproteobacteria bacterium]|nr:DUF1156 domain-containing protein [Gammaproteobacteria bacterium]